MRTVKLLLEYDGTDFVGWQFQNNGRSVQGVLEKALSELLQEPVRVTGAGRTDSGVHAKGQVAHFCTKNLMEPRMVYRALNGMLPDDLVVRSVEEADPGFHARRSATGRRYRYYISQVPVALTRRYRWFVRHPLDLGVMQVCADSIVGEHDFQAFCKVEAAVEHYRCLVRSAQWASEADAIVFSVTANRFLHGMMRALVGTMVEIGRGHRKKEEFEEIIQSKDRTKAGMAAPPCGLVLEEVIYEGEHR